MGILDLFKKKNQTAETPETPQPEATKPVTEETIQPEPAQQAPVAEQHGNDIENIIEETVTEETPVMQLNAQQPLLPFEQLMVEASTNANVRFEFYKQLPNQPVIIITSPNMKVEQGKQTLTENTQVEIATLPDGKIPVFTAQQRIFDNGAVKENVPFIELRASDLFNMTKGATLVLNPFSPFGKELVPEEIAQIMDGRILGGAIEEVAVKNDTQIRIGQPANIPHEMLEQLKIVFAQRNDVNEAYLAMVEMPETGRPPHYLLALDVTGEVKPAFEETGRTAQQFLKQGDSIDIMQLVPENNLSVYFSDREPFFKK